MRAVLPAIWFVAFLWAVNAEAQHVSLDLRNGQATLDARNVSVEQILAEWARVGNTTVIVVNSERIASPPVTLLLRDLSERQALEILLRDVRGYVLGSRGNDVAGRSVFDRIVILQSSVAPPSSLSAGASRASTPSVRADVNDSRDAQEDTPDQPEVAALNVTRPPTPLAPPPPPPQDPRNPFGSGIDSTRPGVVTPTGPPPGVLYPPVTNPALGRSGGAASPTQSPR